MTAKPKARSGQKVPESGVLRACLDLLAAERIWHLRMNTGAMKIGKRFTRFGRPGTADILATPKVESADWCGLLIVRIKAPHPLWIECKSDSGKQTEDQQFFQAEVEAQGHAYLLVRDVDTLRDWLKERGVVTI
jgi:hypothetical protein